MADRFDAYMDVCEELGWVIDFVDDDMIELRKNSPAGEDFSIRCYPEVFIADVCQQYEDFNPEDHVIMWIEAKKFGVGGIPSIKTLVEDADAIEEMLGELADALMKKESEFGDC